MILHTINKTSALGKCQSLIAETDRVVLLEDGVNLGLRALPFNAVAIRSDVEARGLQDRIGDTALISYSDFVELSEAADKVVAWF